MNSWLLIAIFIVYIPLLYIIHWNHTLTVIAFELFTVIINNCTNVTSSG